MLIKPVPVGQLIHRVDRSLTAKILLAFALVILVGIGGVAVLANQRTTAAFERYLQDSDRGSVAPSGDNGQTAGTPFPRPRGDDDPRPHDEPPRLSPSDRDFLAQANQSLLLAALGATVAALLLGMLLARQVILPLRQLTRGAQRIAHGYLDERIDVNGQDEVGQLARAFNDMAESLQRTENARRQLVADVAHELRTPLMVIGTTVEAMQDGVLPTDATNLATIREEVGSLARLVSDLRDLTLGDVGQLAVERRPLELADVLTSIGSAFASSALVRQITLTVDCPPDLPGVLGDETRLRQCIGNLVENALRHTPAGGRVTIRGTWPGDLVIVQVIDTGEGIAPENLPYVFERFFRVDPSRNRRSGGTGLGLAIVQQIIRAHDGEVSVASEGVGMGTTFTIRLPANPRIRDLSREIAGLPERTP
ncbi:MAG TPA: ATP-binding protein [Chloroflexota bacterium]|nr:ATP-binding protein [Chloroflexota bacterium]